MAVQGLPGLLGRHEINDHQGPDAGSDEEKAETTRYQFEDDAVGESPARIFIREGMQELIHGDLHWV